MKFSTRFLTSTLPAIAGAFLVLLCLPQQVNAAQTMNTTLTGSPYSLRKLPVKYQTKALVALGYESMWVTLNNRNPDIKKLKKYLATREIQSGALNVDIVRWRMNPADHYNPKRMAPLYELLVELDLPLWVWPMGKKRDPEVEEKTVAMFKAIAADAKKHNVDIVIYPHANFFVRNARDSLNIIKKVGAGNLKLSVMWCHEVKSGDYVHIRDIMDEVAPYLSIASVNGADQRGAGKGGSWNYAIMPIDQGDIDISPFIESLAKHNFQGPILYKNWGIKEKASSHLPKGANELFVHYENSKLALYS